MISKASRPGAVLAAVLLTVAMCMSGLTAANATIVGWGGRDVTFTPPTLNGSVQTIIQLKIGANAGKYMIGGDFTNAGGNSAIDYVARLNADGTIDTGFTPPTFANGNAACVQADGTNAPLIQVRALLEVQTTSGSNTAGKIYIAGNFTSGGLTKQDYLTRVSANGATNTGFYPTSDGSSTGTASYTNCVHTIFTGEGSGSSKALLVGTQSNTRLSKKVFDTGANAAGFTAPSFNASAVTTGFYCPAATCGSDRYVIGGRFSQVAGDTKMARLVRLTTAGAVDTSTYPTTDGTSSGTILFDSAVNSIALTSSGTSILVGGKFTEKLAKVGVSTFAPSSGFTEPSISADVYSVAVDANNQFYVFGGAFTDAGGYAACDYVCSSDTTGAVVDSTDRSPFAAPPPDAEVRAVTVNDYADTNIDKYMIGGSFTNLGGNTSTDYVARLNQATPSTVTVNSAGGNTAGGADGIRTLYSNGQFQVYRGGTGQLYEPTTVPADQLMYNQVALSLTDPGGGGYAIGPSSLNLSNQNIDFAGGYLFRPWDSVTATGGSTGSGSASSDLTVEVDGLTYVVHLAMSYSYPDNYIRQTFTVDIPTGNTYNVKLFNLYDSYLGGSDFGPGFYNAAAKIVGVSGSTSYEGLRYVSGQAWDGYASADYYDVVFGNDFKAAAPTGPGYGVDLDGSIITDPTNDNGFGINWDFGSDAGTTSPVVDDFIFQDNTPPTASPTSVAGQIQVDWTDPVGVTPSPDSYLVTAYDGSTPTGFTCTATAPTKTCTISGLDPAIAYSFLVEFKSSGSTVFNSASTPVHAKREVPLHIWGDPDSSGPAITFNHRLGDVPDSYMAGYTGLTAANQAPPTVTPNCDSGTITPVEATEGSTAGEYLATVGCQDGLTDINSYQVKVTVGGGSCLVAGGISPGAGTYNVGTSQQSIPTYGTNLPDGASTPAYLAVKDGSPLMDFARDDTAGVYLPAARACQPSAAPSTSATQTTGGAIPMTNAVPLSNGGSALFQVADLGGINGYNRVLAEPSNTTGTGGGYRMSYSRCGVTNGSPTSVNCQLGPPSGVPVSTGGLGGFWNPGACAGQTIGFRSRYMTQMGYGLWSDAGTKIMSGGCS